MYLVKKEIFDQYNALQRTYDYFIDKADEIRSFWSNNKVEGITFTGCGSSYSICRSAEVSAMMRLGISSSSMATGDLLVNFNHYENIIKNTMLIAPSRSGSTSEVILAIKKAKDAFDIPCVSISTKVDSEVGRLADLSLEIPWAFDESVCQTRTVTNLYMACLLFIGIIGEDKKLLEEIKKAIEAGEAYMDQYKDVLKEIGETPSWEKVVVLGDSEVRGIAEEGALAFMEICRIPANFHNVLDVRHGPMVLINDKTLVIALCSPEDQAYQQDLIEDLKAKGALVVTVSTEDENTWGSDYNIRISKYENFGVMGIPFIFVPQALSYYKAIHRGINPDKPEGLNPYIEL